MKGNKDILRVYDYLAQIHQDLQDIMFAAFAMKEGIIHTDTLASISSGGMGVIYVLVGGIVKRVELLLDDCKAIMDESEDEKNGIS